MAGMQVLPSPGKLSSESRVGSNKGVSKSGAITKSQLSLWEEGTATAGPPPKGWRVRVSKRARRLSINVFAHGGVEIVVPPRTSARSVADFVRSERTWIDNTCRSIALLPSDPGPSLPTRIELPAIHESIEVIYRQSNRTHYRNQGTRLLVFSVDPVPHCCWPILRRWLKGIGRKTLRPWVGRLAKAIQVKPRQVQIRLQQTCWGSCSVEGTISLNASALLLPPEQAEYLLVHELCHLRHLNHCHRFWRLVSEFSPRYRELDAAVNRAWTSMPAWVSY